MFATIYCNILPNKAKLHYKWTLYSTVKCIGVAFKELWFLNFIFITCWWHSVVFNSFVSNNSSIYASGRFKPFPVTQSFILFDVLNFNKSYRFVNIHLKFSTAAKRCIQLYVSSCPKARNAISGGAKCHINIYSSK